MKQKAPLFSIILAAGKGTRLRSSTKHKVCFEIDGIPAINRAIRIYNECGIKKHLIVVGAMAEQVMETVGTCFDNTFYAYQPEQIGTADAVRIGIASLEELPESTDIFVVAGDRIIDSSVMQAFFNYYYANKYDLALLTVPNYEGSGQGKIVLDDNGEILAIEEVADIRQRKAFKCLRQSAKNGSLPSSADFANFLKSEYASSGIPIPKDEKMSILFGDIWKRFVIDGEKFDDNTILNAVPVKYTQFEYTKSNGKKYIKTPAEIESATFANNSVYITKLSALKYALAHLNCNNAQKEEYFSDTISILMSAKNSDGTGKFKVGMHNVENRELVLGFNDPAELLDAENTIRKNRESSNGKKLPESRWFRSIGKWKEIFNPENAISEKSDSEFLREIKALYCDDISVIKAHLRNYNELIECAETTFGSKRTAFLVRSPGQINVMGRHIDHQGGNCNLMTIGYETLMLVSLRDDDVVRMFNCNAKLFKKSEFSIGEMLVDLPWDDWLSLVNSDKLNEMINTYGVDWSNYIQAAVLRLQKKFPHRKLHGMDIMVWGNIPMAAGLNSSSSLVVGAAQAVIATNQINTFPAQLVTLCDEGEWFVGTRGGGADHAAVVLGQKRKVVKVGFFDFLIEESVDFPEDYVMLLCDSGIEAQKSSNAKNQFNHRISCYRIGLKLIHKFFPQYSHLINHLRDVNMRDLRLPLSWIYKILLHLPEKATRNELRALLPEEDIDLFFNTHKEPEDGIYPIRGVVMFGLTECERSRLYADLLKEGRISEIGKLMNISHNGDRVAFTTKSNKMKPFKAPISNNYLLGLIDDLESGDLNRVTAAQLQYQSGSYSCSLPEIDAMVDIALGINGVAGAQLAGAGLGGCMMILAHKDSVEQIIEVMNARQSNSLKDKTKILVCKPVASAGILFKP